ncbi:DUF1616 domain-containing protein [Halorubrum depositum]|uniref:DUF1616 domain-containing protein n=1 Tax=Halorubrum depositum TaxID=2583992 RepID=UPI00119DC71D|nr:DUF1616 domain-containing protein [Halorubrum depositum]
MNTSHPRWTLDLLLVVVGAVTALAVILLGVPGSILRSLFVVPLIVLYPGYAVLAAVFPERRSDVESDRMDADQALTRPTTHTAGLLFSVRLALAAALSLAIVGGIALITNFLGLGFAAPITGVGAFAVTMLFTAVAIVRRATLPRETRAGLPSLAVALGSLPDAVGDTRSPLSGGSRGSSISLVVHVLVVVSVLLFLSSVGFAMVETQSPDAEFTEAYLVTENGSEYDAGGYPQQLTRGEPTQTTLAIANHEHQTQRYTVVSELQRLDRTANGSRVVEKRELWRAQQSVEDGETAYLQRDVTPTMSGDSLRLVFHVYRGEAPENPTRQNAYRTVQLVVTVGDGDGGTPAIRSPPTGGASA